MIFTERTIMVVNDSATINKPLILYRGDKNIELKITITKSQFKFRSTGASNVIETSNASYAQLVINTPYDLPIFSEVTATENGTVIFVITEAMIDEIREVGAYEIQIRLLDDNKQSRASIPPVSNAIEIREPIAIEDGSAVDSNAVNVAKVNRALTTTSAPLEAFDSQGNYIKNIWGDGVLITDAALNKMEAGIDGVNKKVVTKTSQLTNDANYASETFVTNKIAEAQLGGGSAVVIRKKPYQSNSKIALDIPSKNNEYLNQYTHPSVVNFAEGWNNYKYWMAVTPYTNINQSLENPHIVASNDMIHWKEPNPDANPLDLPADTGDTYLSDVCLVYNSDLNRLECWYRGVAGTTETIYRKSTTDGMVWSERETLRTTTGSTAKQICPIIKYFDNKYNIWISENRNLAFYESTDGANWTLVRRYELPLWHFDVLLNNGKYKLFCGVGGNLNSLSLYSSDDNITFTLTNEKILETGQAGNFDDARIYKPSCIYENGQYYLFYGGWSNKSLTHAVNGDCKIGFTRTFDGDITNLVGLDYIDTTSKEKNYMKNLKIYEKAEVDDIETDNISSNTAKTVTQTLTNSRGINVDLSIDSNGENIYATKDNKEKKVVLFEHGVSTNRPATYTNYGFYYDYTLRKLLIYIGGTWYDMMGNVIAAHVAVTGVAFTTETVSLDINQSSTLEYTITPSNATNKNVSFTIAPEGIASITSTGRVTGTAEGTATVTITTEDGSHTDTCTISVSSTVVEPPAESPNLYNKEGVINARYSSFPTLLEGVFCELREGYVVTNSNGWSTNKCLGQFIDVEPDTWYTIKVKAKNDSLSKSHYLVMYKDDKTKINIYDANKTTSKANQSGETYSEVTYKLQTDSSTRRILATFGQAGSEKNPTTYETIYFGKEL